jgi:hypothetical protein
MMKTALAGAFSLGLPEPDAACLAPADMGAEPCLVAGAGDPPKAMTREMGMG